MNRIFASLLAALVLLGVAGTANSTLINFDVDQAAFVAPLAGSGSAGQVEVKDQFASFMVCHIPVRFGFPSAPLGTSALLVNANAISPKKTRVRTHSISPLISVRFENWQHTKVGAEMTNWQTITLRLLYDCP